ncbi:MAG: Rpn family recombination-promoting nuclease/putative transposase, partial [Planctomycetota bacterium]
MLFTVRPRGSHALLYALLEATVRPGRWVALQVLGYVVGIWKELRRRKRKPRLLPPILPIVVSFGARRWCASTDLASLFDLAAVPPALGKVVLAAMPQFRFAPHDFARKTAAEIRAMGLSELGLATIAAEQFIAPVGHDDDRAIRAIVDWADALRKLLRAPAGQEGFAAISSYILKVTKLGRRRLGAIFERH